MSQVESLFHVLDQSSLYISTHLQKSYLEGLIDTGEQLFQKEILLDLPKQQKEDLELLYRGIILEEWSKEERRKSFQLALLKGLNLQQEYSKNDLTPDGVCLLMAHILRQLVKKPGVICDPAVGTNNLLSAVINAFPDQPQGYGTEVDLTLVRLAYANANLQEQEVELYHQDGLKAIFSPPAEIVVCDLPIGIYPNQNSARKFQLFAEGEVIYTHHLLVEQALQLARPGGYVAMVIPSSLFVEPGAERLRQWMTEEAYLQMLIQLPQEWFQSDEGHKSIVILQKKGENIVKPKQSLLAVLPPTSQKNSFRKMMAQLDDWVMQEKIDRGV